MKNIVFIAPHGTGKGSQCELLKLKYNYHHISTGNLIRDAIAKHDEFAQSLEEVVNKGLLVSDEIVLDLLYKYIKDSNIQSDIIFDGFPRTLSQAQSLDKLLGNQNLQIDLVIYLKISKEEALKRSLGRLTCPKCHKSYNKNYDYLKPKEEGICDECQIPLVSRSDDNTQAFMRLFAEFEEKTKPILDYYEQQNKLLIIDAQQTQDEIFINIVQYL